MFFLLGLGLGFCTGSFLGVVALCLCMIRKETEEDEEQGYVGSGQEYNRT